MDHGFEEGVCDFCVSVCRCAIFGEKLRGSECQWLLSSSSSMKMMMKKLKGKKNPLLSLCIRVCIYYAQKWKKYDGGGPMGRGGVWV